MNLLVFSLLFLFGGSLASSALPDFDKLWDYSNAARTETLFREILPEAQKSGDRDYLFQLLSQLARTQSLQRRFPEAHEILDGIEAELDSSTPVAKVRYLLERGRTFNSDKRKLEAGPLFLEAYELAVAGSFDFHGIDAAHMMAIVEPASEQQLEWNLKALAMAERTSDPKARGWLGSLYNNIGWTIHGAGKFQEAHEIFKKAQVFQEERKQPEEIRIAKWSVARALRSLERLDEALVIQRQLEKEYETLNQPSGYVFEELAELLLLMGESGQARGYFRLVYELLSQDPWLVANEPERLARLKKIGEGA